MRKLKLAIAAIGVTLMSSLPVHAEPSAELKPHIKAWLDGNDAESLQGFAQLAAKGDTAAQLLLGQIDKVQVTTGLSNYLKAMSYQDRADLLRKRTDDGYVNWLFTMDDDVSQKLFFAQRLYLESPELVAEMSDIGESALAHDMLLTFMLRGRFDLVQALSQKPELVATGPVAWVSSEMAATDHILNMEFVSKNRSPALLRGLLAYRSLTNSLRIENRMANDLLAVVDVLEGDLAAAQGKSDLLSIDRGLRLLATSDASLNTLLTFCDTVEKGDPFCLAEATFLLGGYDRLANLRTPTDQIIPQADYLQSIRAQQDLKQMLTEGLKRQQTELRSVALRSIAP